eukprot:scaffold2111_cov167-Ochromonas_danica.AAC.4
MEWKPQPCLSPPLSVFLFCEIEKATWKWIRVRQHYIIDNPNDKAQVSQSQFLRAHSHTLSKQCRDFIISIDFVSNNQTTQCYALASRDMKEVKGSKVSNG